MSRAFIQDFLEIGIDVGFTLGRFIDVACRADSEALRAAFVTLGFTTLGCDHSFYVRSLHVIASGQHSFSVFRIEVLCL